MEQFETFDDEGRAIGLAARADVHRLGLWHRSAHVFLFDGAGALLVQQRAADKDLYAGLWDYSVGEHLKPGETYAQGAARGLHEELGIQGAELMPIGVERRVRHAGPGFLDYEMQQAFRCQWDGPLRPDPVEISQVRFVAAPDLRAWIRRTPEAFTPWFIDDVERLRILDPG